MKRRRLSALSIIIVAVITGLFLSAQTVLISAQNHQHGTVGAPFPIYNPYPPGILPADLESEIARVLREIDVIEERAIQRWHSLPPPVRFGQRPGPNPPVLQGT